MIVTIDSNTLPVELYHLSILFQSLAKAHGFVAPVASTKLEDFTVKLDIDTTDATAAIDKLAAHAATKGVDVTDTPPATVTVAPPVDLAQAESNAAVETERQSTDIVINDKLDADGLPWDARIHSGSRERNTNGKWRTARKPKALTEDQWQETLIRVAAELRDLMEIPVSTGAVADAAAETAEAMADCFGGEPSDYSTQPLTDAEVDAFVDIMQGVVVAPPVTIAPPVVIPPVTAVAPPITVDKPAIETFAQLMTWLTSRTPKDEAAKPAMVIKVNEILVANGLTTLQQLGQRSELIPQVLVQFREAFGE